MLTFRVKDEAVALSELIGCLAYHYRDLAGQCNDQLLSFVVLVDMMLLWLVGRHIYIAHLEIRGVLGGDDLINDVVASGAFLEQILPTEQIRGWAVRYHKMDHIYFEIICQPLKIGDRYGMLSILQSGKVRIAHVSAL